MINYPSIKCAQHISNDMKRASFLGEVVLPLLNMMHIFINQLLLNLKKLECFSSRLEVVYVQSIEARC